MYTLCITKQRKVTLQHTSVQASIQQTTKKNRLFSFMNTLSKIVYRKYVTKACRQNSSIIVNELFIVGNASSNRGSRATLIELSHDYTALIRKPKRISTQQTNSRCLPLALLTAKLGVPPARCPSRNYTQLYRALNHIARSSLSLSLARARAEVEHRSVQRERSKKPDPTAARYTRENRR